MKRLFLAVLMVSMFALVSCGGYSESDFTDDSIKLACKMMHTCDEADFQMGDNEKDCVTTMKAFASMSDGSEEKCNFNSSNAEDCIDCEKKLSCADYFGAEDKCPICEKVCE